MFIKNDNNQTNLSFLIFKDNLNSHTLTEGVEIGVITLDNCLMCVQKLNKGIP